MRSEINIETEEEKQFWDFVSCIEEALEKYSGKAMIEFSHKEHIANLKYEIRYASTLFAICKIGFCGASIAPIDEPFKHLMYCLRQLEAELVALHSKRFLPLIREAIESGIKIKGIAVVPFKKTHMHRFLRRQPVTIEQPLGSVVEESKTLT